MPLNTLSLSLLIPAAVSFVLIRFLWRRRSLPGATTFLLVNVAMAVWALGYCFELASTDLSIMLVYYRLQYLGIPFIPVLFIILVLQTTGKNRWMKPHTIIMLIAIPLLTMIINWTNGYHNLFYTGAELGVAGEIPVLVLTRGYWFWVHIAYSYVVMYCGLVIIVQHLFQSRTIYRNQLIILLIGVLLTLTANVASVLLPESPFKPLDITPFIFTFSNIIITWGMFRYQLFEIMPVARDSVIERMKDGMIVLDERERLVDCNPSALRIFNWPKPPIGKYASQLWHDWPEMLQMSRSSRENVIKGRQVTDGNIRFYNVTVSELRDNQDRATGRLIMLNDVTVLKESENDLLALSVKDSLTGLYNRLGFYRMAEHQIKVSDRENEKLLLLFVDLDDMKAVNDTYGHLEGDNALKDTAYVLVNTFRKSDIIARIGGDEFVVLAPCKNEIDAVVAVSRLQKHVEHHNKNSGRSYRLSLSCGVSLYHPGDSVSIDDLIRRADADMYGQKKHSSSRTNSDAVTGSYYPTG